MNERVARDINVRDLATARSGVSSWQILQFGDLEPKKNLQNCLEQAVRREEQMLPTILKEKRCGC